MDDRLNHPKVVGNGQPYIGPYSIRAAGLHCALLVQTLSPTPGECHVNQRLAKPYPWNMELPKGRKYSLLLSQVHIFHVDIHASRGCLKLPSTCLGEHLTTLSWRILVGYLCRTQLSTRFICLSYSQHMHVQYLMLVVISLSECRGIVGSRSCSRSLWAFRSRAAVLSARAQTCPGVRGEVDEWF